MESGEVAQDNSNLEKFFYASGDNPKPEVNPEHLRVYGHML